MQTFPSIPGLYYVNEDHIRFVLRWYYVNAVVSTTLLSPYCVLVRSRPHYDFFEHVQNSPTPTKTMKIASRPYRFLLRSYYVVQVRTASKRFYIDVVGTWSSVTGVLATHNQDKGKPCRPESDAANSVSDQRLHDICKRQIVIYPN